MARINNPREMLMSMKNGGTVPTHFDRDTPIVKLECGGPSPGGWWATEGGEVITTEDGTIITN